MQFREKSGQSLTEPVTAADFKTYIGYSGTDQDALIAILLTAVRIWVERFTGLSAIAKTYEVFFEAGDDINGWYELPISPVNAVVSTQINGSDVDCTEAGLINYRIYPGCALDYNGLSVEYTVTASAEISILKTAINRITANLFTQKRDMSELTVSSVDFDTKMLLDSIKKPAI